MIALIMVIIFFTVLLWSHFMCCFHESTNVLVLKKSGIPLSRKPGTRLLKKPGSSSLKTTAPLTLSREADGFEVILSFNADSFSDNDSTSDLLIFLLKHRNIPIQHKKNSTALETKSEPCIHYSIDDMDDMEAAPRLINSESGLSKFH